LHYGLHHTNSGAGKNVIIVTKAPNGECASLSLFPSQPAARIRPLLITMSGNRPMLKNHIFRHLLSAPAVLGAAGGVALAFLAHLLLAALLGQAPVIAVTALLMATGLVFGTRWGARIAASREQDDNAILLLRRRDGSLYPITRRQARKAGLGPK
jgi:lysylphosphatidylglycerol synthetase-like protein (DUF2156 family)